MSHAGTRTARPRPFTLPEAAPDAKVLVLLAHPALFRSRVNRRLADVARATPGVTLHDLYEAYPDFDIDVRHEQALLAAHEAVVFQHPFYWYSTPAILKEWQDLVLEFNWAYGPEGTALRGKRFLSAITTGGPERAYQPEGFNRFTIRQLLAPVEQTSRLCGMSWRDPFVVHGTHRLEDAEIARAALAYREALESLRDGGV